MGLAEQWTRDQQRADDEAEAQEMRDSARADELRDEFNKLVKARDIDGATGVACMPRLFDVMSEATCLIDDTIFRKMMQALVHCAAKGQIEAVEAMAEVKQFFVDSVMEN